MDAMTMTTADFKSRLETLSSDDLEGYSDVVEDFGASLLEYCDRPDVADETVSTYTDLDDMCSRAIMAVMCGETLEQAQAHITDAHSAASGARAILADLYRQWHTPTPA